MLTNENFRTDWKTGDTCFIHEAWTDNIHKGIIRKITTDDNGKTIYIIDNKIGRASCRERVFRAV